MVRRPRVPDGVTMRLASCSSLEANQSMPRYKLTIEYDGTPFVGWQMQENGVSVQGRLAEAIKAFSGEDAVPRGAGRTDAGVHVGSAPSVKHAILDHAAEGGIGPRA